MSGDSDLPHFTVPPLKAYQRSNLRPTPGSHGDSPSKYGKKGKGPSSPFSWLPGSPLASFAPSSSSSSSNFSRQTLCFLIVLIAVTSLITLRYLGHLSSFVQSEDIGTSPTMISLSRHEAKQTEKVLELMAKVDEMRDMSARAIGALESILEKAGNQQEQLRGLEQKLQEGGLVAPGPSAEGVNVLAQASDATAAVVAGRVSEVAFGIRTQIEALGKQLNATITHTAASLGRGRALSDEGRREDEGVSGDGTSVGQAVSRLSSAVEVAAQQSSLAMRRLEDRVNELARRGADMAGRRAAGEEGAGQEEGGGEGGGSAVDTSAALKRIEDGVSKVVQSVQHIEGRGSAHPVLGDGEGMATAGGAGQLSLDLLQQQVTQLVQEVSKMRSEGAAHSGAGGKWEGGGVPARAVPAEEEEYSKLQKLARMVAEEIKGGLGVGPSGVHAAPGEDTGSTASQQQCAGLEKQARAQSALVANLRLQLETLSAELSAEETDITLGDEDAAGPASLEPRGRAGVSSRALRLWRQGAFHKSGSYGFISFSGYRVSRSSFVSVGLGLVALHKTRDCPACVWSSGSGSVSLRGKARLVFPQSDHGQAYEALLLFCDFAAPVPAGGGHLSAFIDHELVLLYREAPEEYSTSVDPVAPFPSSVSVCLPPLSSPSLQPLLLKQWLAYHRLVGADRAVLYNAGALGPENQTLLRMDISSGVVDVVDFREIRRFQVWNYGEVVALHDCMYRLRYVTGWVMYADMDDYLWLPRVPQALKGAGTPASRAEALRGSIMEMLQPYVESGGVTMGSLWFSVNKCRTRAEHVDEVLLPAAGAPPVHKVVGSEGAQAGAVTASGSPQAAQPQRRLLQEEQQARRLVQSEQEQGLAAAGLSGESVVGREGASEEAAAAGSVTAAQGLSAPGGGAPALSVAEGAALREQLVSRTEEEAGEREFAVERFVFHWPGPACFGNKEKGVMLDPHLCPGRRGHRRFFVNPRKVERMGTYGPLEADLKEVNFMHLITSDAMFLHYDGLGTRLRIGETVCNETVPLWTKLAWWSTDPSFAQAFATIRNHSPCNFMADGCLAPTTRHEQ